MNRKKLDAGETGIFKGRDHPVVPSPFVRLTIMFLFISGIDTDRDGFLESEEVVEVHCHFSPCLASSLFFFILCMSVRRLLVFEKECWRG
jgi:hypothetical protein